MSADKLQNWPGVIRQYQRHLPVTEDTPIVTLGEGNTPLVPAHNFVESIGGKFELHLKYEGLNPTCSFKDRGMTMAISKAKENGAEVVICASTGNTSAAAAAYAARAKMQCVVLIPNGNIAVGKLAQALLYGSTTVAIEGNFDEALRIVRELGETGKVEVVNSINPFRIEGQKTASFEICDQLGRAPDFHFLPVGNAGNITAYWKGYKEYFSVKLSDRLPRMFGYQAAGAAPIVDGAPVEQPNTVATAIRIGNPASWDGAQAAIAESNGHINKVTDEEILAAYKRVATSDGVIVEPASAASLAGVIKANAEGMIPDGSVVTATMSGHGLKDPDNAIKNAGFEPTVVEATREAVMKVIGL
ncbi:MAG: threonine synthase [Verrucomicrobiales bacterium]|nr:threonine synthase [Verrucomicrobiales bacterium]|tara:strand:+ start:2581 stop:3657 length:1077 start_codon:yes stop_codon:yes gene_type:complete